MENRQDNNAIIFILLCAIVGTLFLNSVFILNKMDNLLLRSSAATATTADANVTSFLNLPCEDSLSQGRVFVDETWLDALIESIWFVESSCRTTPPDGDGGEAVGPLQLHGCVLADVNNYYGTGFRASDARDLAIAKQIAAMYIRMWMDKRKTEIAARIFKGGPRGWRKKSTDEYWEKILATENTEATEK